MEKFTGSTSHSDRATKGKNKGQILINILENHRDEEELKRLNANAILEGKEPKYDIEKSKQNIEIIRPSELSIEGCYEDVFKESIERFNATQKRSDRKQSVEKILDKMRHSNILQDPLQAMVVQVGNKERHPSKEVLIDIYNDYVDEFKNRFPNLKIVSCAIHLDETDPHLQFYYIPVKYKEKCTEEAQKKWRGIDMQPSMTGALEQMGYSNEATKSIILEDGSVREMKDFKQGALAQFQKDFNGLLDEICKKYDIEIDHYLRGKKVQHQDTKTWEELRKEKELEAHIDQLEEAKTTLIIANDELQGEVTHLTAQVKEKTTLLERLEGLFVALQSKVEDFFSTKEKHAKMEATERQKGKPESILHRTFGSARKAREEAESAYSKLKGVPFKREAVESVESTFRSFEQKADCYKEAVEKVEEELEVEGWEL